MQIADIPTLTRAKIIAADANAFSERKQDMPDLIELLDHQGIRTFRDFERAYPDEFGENDSAHEQVAAHFGVVREPKHDRYPDELAQYADLLDGFDDLDRSDGLDELDGIEDIDGIDVPNEDDFDFYR